MSKPEVIESTQRIDGAKEIYILPSGKRVEIGPYDLSFFYKLQGLPMETKLAMMKLSEGDIERFLQEKYTEQLLKVIKLFSQKWEFCDTGDAADFSNGEMNMMYFNVHKSAMHIIKQAKKRVLKKEEMQRIINFFESGKDVRVK